MKICSKCKNEYEYYGQKNTLCKSCKCEYQRARYAKKTPKQKAAYRATDKKRQLRIRLLVRKYKQKLGCQDCGNKNPIVLDFDHRDPSKKHLSVSEMSGYAEAKVRKEMNKCDVVCANCHRIRTAK